MVVLPKTLYTYLKSNEEVIYHYHRLQFALFIGIMKVIIFYPDLTKVELCRMMWKEVVI